MSKEKILVCVCFGQFEIDVNEELFSIEAQQYLLYKINIPLLKYICN